MPISTPDVYYKRYKEDQKHFLHVLECLFIPAVEKAGFTPIPPIAEGSEHIHAKIIETLTESDLVLCDMSILNANVFFELGVRTALDKPVALIADSDTVNVPPHIPFDVRNINFHEYNPSLAAYDTKVELPKLVEHIKNCAKTSDGRNTLWKYYGITQTGILNPEDATISNKLDLILSEHEKLRADFLKLEHQVTRDDSHIRRMSNKLRSTSEKNTQKYLEELQTIEVKDSPAYTWRDEALDFRRSVLRKILKPDISKMTPPYSILEIKNHLAKSNPDLLEEIPMELVDADIKSILSEMESN